MSQLSFGTSRALRDKHYRLLMDNGIDARRFSISGQVIHDQYVGTIYMLDVDTDMPRTYIQDMALSATLEMSHRAQESLPKSPLEDILKGRPQW